MNSNHSGELEKREKKKIITQKTNHMKKVSMADNISSGLSGKKRSICKLRGGVLTMGNNLVRKKYAGIGNPQL